MRRRSNSHASEEIGKLTVDIFESSLEDPNREPEVSICLNFVLFVVSVVGRLFKQD